MFQTDMAADIIVNQLSPGPHSTLHFYHSGNLVHSELTFWKYNTRQETT